MRLTLLLWLGGLALLHLCLALREGWLARRGRTRDKDCMEQSRALFNLLEVQVGSIPLVLSLNGPWWRIVSIIVMWSAAIIQFGVIRPQVSRLTLSAPYERSNRQWRLCRLGRQLDIIKVILGLLVLITLF